MLAALRERFDLPAVAGPGDDLTRAVRVQDWIKSLFSHRIPWRMPEWNADRLDVARVRHGLPDGSCPANPDRLWLNQIEVLGPTALHQT